MKFADLVAGQRLSCKRGFISRFEGSMLPVGARYTIEGFHPAGQDAYFDLHLRTAEDTSGDDATTNLRIRLIPDDPRLGEMRVISVREYSRFFERAADDTSPRFDEETAFDELPGAPVMRRLVDGSREVTQITANRSLRPRDPAVTPVDAIIRRGVLLELREEVWEPRADASGIDDEVTELRLVSSDVVYRDGEASVEEAADVGRSYGVDGGHGRRKRDGVAEFFSDATPAGARLDGDNDTGPIGHRQWVLRAEGDEFELDELARALAHHG